MRVHLSFFKKQTSPTLGLLFFIGYFLELLVCFYE